MNLGHKIIILAICILPLCLQNCTIKYYDTDKLLNDYKTEGFLDRDHFQVIIKGKPDKESAGLVLKRESALRKAKSLMNDVILGKLIDYNLDHHIRKTKIKRIENINNIEKVRRALRKGLSEYLEYGHIAFEYYNRDNSAVLVFRIYKEDLVDDIESIEPDLEIDQ